MSSTSFDPAAPEADLRRRGLSPRRRRLQGSRGRRVGGRDRPARPDRVQGLRPCLARDQGVRAQLRLDGRLESRHQRVRRTRVRLRDGRHVADRTDARGAAVDRDRALPHRDRTSSGRGADRDDGRAAGGDPERRPRALGHPRVRPVGARPSRAVAVAGRRRLPRRSSPASQSQAGILPAALVLTIMIIPITSSICRELFLRVLKELTDASRSARHAGSRSAA